MVGKSFSVSEFSETGYAQHLFIIVTNFGCWCHSSINLPQVCKISCLLTVVVCFAVSFEACYMWNISKTVVVGFLVNGFYLCR